MSERPRPRVQATEAGSQSNECTAEPLRRETRQAASGADVEERLAVEALTLQHLAPRRFAPRDPVVVHDREEPRSVVAEPEPPALAAHAGRGPRRRRRSAASSSIAISMTETNWYTTKWTR